MKKAALGFRGNYYSLSGIQALHTQVIQESTIQSFLSTSNILKILVCDEDEQLEEEALLLQSTTLATSTYHGGDCKKLFLNSPHFKTLQTNNSPP